MKTRYFPLKLLTKNLIFIDGINRTGKLLTGSLLSSLNKMEHLEFGEIFQHIVPAIKLKKINLYFAKALLHNYLNQTIYNKYLSRNVNFRNDDRTGILNSKNPSLYIKRLKKKEGDKVIKEIKIDKPYIPFVTHDIMCNYSSFLKLNINIKIIEIFRSPIDLVYSWHKKKLSLRYGKDKRIFTLLIQKKGNPYSQHLYNLPKDWNNLNDIERCILYVKILTERSVKELKKKYKKNTIFITTYENITISTKNELEKIAKFLNTKISTKTNSFIKKNNCPIIINNNSQKDKLNYIKKKSSKKYFNIIKLMELSYRKNIYGLDKYILNN